METKDINITPQHVVDKIKAEGYSIKNFYEKEKQAVEAYAESPSVKRIIIEIGIAAIVTLCAFTAGYFSGKDSIREEMRKDLIESGHAYYNRRTGEWTMNMELSEQYVKTLKDKVEELSNNAESDESTIKDLKKSNEDLKKSSVKAKKS